jgi:hypothetical protein
MKEYEAELKEYNIYNDYEDWYVSGKNEQEAWEKFFDTMLYNYDRFVERSSFAIEEVEEGSFTIEEL